MVQVIVKPWLYYDMYVEISLSRPLTTDELSKLEIGVRLFLSLCILNGFPFSTFFFRYILEKIDSNLSHKVVKCALVS